MQLSLAAAGLQRLGLARRDVYPISTELCLPLQVRARWELSVSQTVQPLQLLQPLVDTQTERCVRAEQVSALALAPTALCLLRRWPVQ